MIKLSTHAFYLNNPLFIPGPQILHMLTYTDMENSPKSGTLVFVNVGQAPEQLKAQAEVVILDVTTATQPTNQISAIMQCNYHCYRDTRFIVEDKGLIQRILLASSPKNCIPVLSVTLTAFTGL